MAALLVGFAGPAYGRPKAVSKAEIQSILVSIDQAIANSDQAALVAHMASNAVISVTATVIEDAGGYRAEATYNKDELTDWLKLGLLAYSPGKPRRTAISIHIASNGQLASCRSTVIERCSRLDGAVLNATCTETLSFGRSNGRVMVTGGREVITIR